MNYTEKTKPGMGDPYWYEWSVGEQQIINMLNEDNLGCLKRQRNVGYKKSGLYYDINRGKRNFR